MSEKKQPLQRHREARDTKALASENRTLLRQLDIADRRAGVVEALRAQARPPRKRRVRESLHKRVATPFFMLSDLHVEETVTAASVGGVNAFTLEEANRRLARTFKAMCWMIDHHRKSFEIREAALWLGGDLLTGHIHPELAETTSLSPVQALLWLQERLTRGIEMLLSVPGIERLRVPCSVGNHGRTGLKMTVATVTEHSFEWLLYHQLRRIFARDSRVEFIISDGNFLRMQVHGLQVGMHHGHAVKGGGGIGGITVPILRAISKWQTYGACDVWALGHFHQLLSTPRFVVNGSLIGTSPYGMMVGAFEEPAQASFLVDSKRGKCMDTTLWCEGSRVSK